MLEEVNDWISLAVAREAIPKPLRENTVEYFAAEHGISTETYYYQMRKEENKKRILEIALTLAKDEAPAILTVLTEKAKHGDVKSIEMYIDYILKLAKNLDIKSDGKPLPFLDYVRKEKPDKQ